MFTAVPSFMWVSTSCLGGKCFCLLSHLSTSEPKLPKLFNFRAAKESYYFCFREPFEVRWVWMCTSFYVHTHMTVCVRRPEVSLVSLLFSILFDRLYH